jgi:hypothetical protein
VNTPAHAVLGLGLLGRGEARPYTWTILAGSVLPDVPMLLFYFWQRLAVGAPEAEIWGAAYFRDSWQTFFDVFNSAPLALLGLALGWATGRPHVRWFFAAMLLHFIVDLPLHHDDGHRHLLPLSDWRFQSPVSYWDPAHYGAVGALAETLVVVACSASLWRRYANLAARLALLALCLLYVGLYVGLEARGERRTSCPIRSSTKSWSCFARSRPGWRRARRPRLRRRSCCWASCGASESSSSPGARARTRPPSPTSGTSRLRCSGSSASPVEPSAWIRPRPTSPT